MSLQMISRLKPGDSLEVSHAANNLARVLARRGAHGEAADLFRRALAIREPRLKGHDARVWASRSGLALALLGEIGEVDGAGGVRDLEIRVEGTPTQRAGALAEIAGMLMDGARGGDAASMLDGALMIADAEDGVETDAETLVMRAACAVELGALAQAESLLHQARGDGTGAGRDGEAADRYGVVLGGLVRALEEAGRRIDAMRCAGMTLDSRAIDGRE